MRGRTAGGGGPGGRGLANGPTGIGRILQLFLSFLFRYSVAVKLCSIQIFDLKK